MTAEIKISSCNNYYIILLFFFSHNDKKINKFFDKFDILKSLMFHLLMRISIL